MYVSLKQDLKRREWRLNIHETQDTERVGVEPGFRTDFEHAQRIEGGLPLQKVYWRHLPAFIRYIGIFLMTVMLIMLFFTIIVLLR